MKKIVIDLMGSDLGPQELYEGVLLAAKELPHYGFICVGDLDKFQRKTEDLRPFSNRIEFIDAKGVFLNTDSPMDIPKGREDTSLVASFLRGQEEDAIAILSCGSTGGILVSSIFRLGLIKGLRFPALASQAYNKNYRKFAIVDCGANLDMDPKSYVKFAKLGSILAESYLRIENNENASARVGLLNIGKEKGKGNAALKEAYALLEESGLNFVGNIEGDRVYDDLADVLVCDGLAGNVLIKSANGLALLLLSLLKRSLPDTEESRKALEDVRAHFDYNSEGAAVVLGGRKLILKGHGTAIRNTILASCKEIDELYRGGFNEAMAKALE